MKELIMAVLMAGIAVAQGCSGDSGPNCCCQAETCNIQACSGCYSGVGNDDDEACGCQYSCQTKDGSLDDSCCSNGDICQVQYGTVKVYGCAPPPPTPAPPRKAALQDA